MTFGRFLGQHFWGYTDQKYSFGASLAIILGGLFVMIYVEPWTGTIFLFFGVLFMYMHTKHAIGSYRRMEYMFDSQIAEAKARHQRVIDRMDVIDE